MLQMWRNRTHTICEEVSSRRSKKLVTGTVPTTVPPAGILNVNMYNCGPKVIVNVCVLGSTVPCLIDSGSQVTIIPKSYLPSSALSSIKPSALQLQVYNGSSVNMLGTINVDLTIGESILRNRTVYISGSNLMPILGSSEILQSGSFTIDTENKTVSFGKNKVAVEVIPNEYFQRMKVNGILPFLTKIKQQPLRFNVNTKKTITIPPRSEIVAEFALPSSAIGGTYMSRSRAVSSYVNVGRALDTVTTKRCSIRVPLLNHTFEEQVIQTDAFVFEAVEVSENNLAPSSGATINATTITKLTSAQVDSRVEKLMNEMSIDPTAPEIEHKRFKALVKKYNHVFSLTDEKLGVTKVAQFEVNTEDHAPVASGRYRTPYYLREEMQKIISKHIEDGIMKETSSPWAAPCLLVRKQDGSHRLVVDYRKLNDVTTFDAYPLPSIRDSLNYLSKSKVFIAADLQSGFHQLECSEDAQLKLAVTTERGQYTFSRMPMGPKNGPATFQRVMDKVTRGIGSERLLVYLDDLLSHGVTYDEMFDSFEAVLERLSNSGLKIKSSKVKALYRNIEFAGYTISDGTLKPLQRKIEAIVNLAAPQTSLEAQSLYGMFSYHRAFIKDFALLADPISETYRNLKVKPFTWTKAAEDATQLLKSKIAEKTLKLFIPELSNTLLVLETDASDKGIGGCLYFCNKQGIHTHDEFCLQPIEYFAKPFRNGQEKLFIAEKELLAFKFATEKYKTYLLGRKFCWRTDNLCISWARTMSPKKAKLARWLAELEPFIYDVELIRSKKMVISDALSRLRQMEVNSILVESKIRKNDILEMYHTNGHGGISNTLNDIQKLYRWKDMKNDVSDYVKRCDYCQRSKPNLNPRRVKQFKTDTAIGPFKKLSVDLTGPFVTTARHNKFILVAIDNFSKHVYAVPIKSKAADQVVPEIRKILLQMPEIPSEILTDNGREFINELMSAVTTKYNIRHSRSAPYHPQSNGLCERVNLTLKTKVNIHDPNWDIHVWDAVHCINRSPNETTGYSPFAAETGHPGLNPVDPTRKSYDNGSIVSQKIRMRIEKEKESRLKNSGENRPYTIGQLVLQKNSAAIKSDDRTRYIGPYRVEKVLGGGCSYKIVNLETRDSYVRNMSQLKPYLQPYPSKKRQPEECTKTKIVHLDDVDFPKQPKKHYVDVSNLSNDEMKVLAGKVGYGGPSGSTRMMARQLTKFLESNIDRNKARGIIFASRNESGNPIEWTLFNDIIQIPFIGNESSQTDRQIDLISSDEPHVPSTM